MGIQPTQMNKLLDSDFIEHIPKDTVIDTATFLKMEDPENHIDEFEIAL